jgi:hypothetical protein
MPMERSLGRDTSVVGQQFVPWIDPAGGKRLAKL